jgi:small-conductance mechanosensitive channel
MLEDSLDVGIALAIGLGSAAVVALVVHLAMRVASRRSAWARSLVAASRRPFWTLVLLVGLWAGASASLGEYDWWRAASHLFTIAVIGVVAWLLLTLITFVTDVALGYHRIDVPDNKAARRLHTQTLILSRLGTALVIVIAIGAALFTFDSVRAIGASILASAGIISIVAGLAAQSALSNMFAGIQLVFSNALRVDDVIVAEGEWGKVGEITLSYVVLDLWDDRRLVLPCTYFTTTPYQNWTRQGSELLGSVEFDLDWRVSPQRMREHLDAVLAEAPLYDGRASVLQVTEATGGYVRVRILVTAKDAPTLFDLRCFVRESMVLWVQNEMPAAAPAQRVIIDEAGLTPSQPKGKSAPAPETAGDSGLFTGSIEAVERANQFMHGGSRDDADADATGPAA